METADVIVVGLGAMGSAAVYHLGRRGARVIGIDRFSPPHTTGSTHGDTRITRRGVGEGREYVPLVTRSHELWRQIEAEAEVELFTACGGLILTADSVTSGQHGVPDFFQSTVNAAEEFGVEHEVLAPAAIQERFPQFTLREPHRGYYEPGAGFVRPERAVTAQLMLAQRHGAVVHRDERVTRVLGRHDGVTVETGAATYHADHVILAAGPWVSTLVGSAALAAHFTVRRQVLHWFDVKAFTPQMESGEMPVFIWEFGPGEGDSFYGFPAVDGPHGGVKVATEQYHAAFDPDDLNRETGDNEAAEMYRHCVAGRVPGIGPGVVRSAACLYTVTPDHRFIIDRHPEHENIIIASPCSGHGFKHSAAIGEALAEVALDGVSRVELAAFGLARFGA